jgi:hypothetical protein
MPEVPLTVKYRNVIETPVGSVPSAASFSLTTSAVQDNTLGDTSTYVAGSHADYSTRSVLDILYDLGSVQDVRRAKATARLVCLPEDDDGGINFTDLIVYSSNDGTTWTLQEDTFLEEGTNDWGNADFNTLGATFPVSARYWLLRTYVGSAEIAASFSPQVSDFRLYADYEATDEYTYAEAPEPTPEPAAPDSVAEWQVIVRDANGARRRLPHRQITAASWGQTDQGGMDQFSLTVTAELGSLTVQQDDQVDVWVEGLRRYRGFVSEIAQAKGSPDQVVVSGYGLWQRIGAIVCDKSYYEPAGADISVVVGRIIRDFVLRNPEFSGLTTDLQEVGFTVYAVDATLKPLGDVLSDLMRQIDNRAVWGCDVDDQGRDRLFLRPLGSTSDPDLVGAVPSRRVTAADGAARTADSITRLTIQGGTPRFPNLLENASFEKLRFAASEESGDSILEDPGFENRSGWTLHDGASYKAGGLSEGNTNSGQDMVETDNSGEAFSQTEDNVAAIEEAADKGRYLAFGAHVRREEGITASTGWIRLYWRDSGGSESLGYTQIDVAPSSVQWEKYVDTIQVPSAAAGYRIRGECVSGKLLWDDILLYDASLLRQQNWELRSDDSGDGQVLSVDWAYDADTYDGGYCVRVKVEADDSEEDEVQLIPLSRVPILTRGNYRIGCRLKLPPGVTTHGKLLLTLKAYNPDNTDASDGEVYEIDADTLSDSAWTHVYFDHAFAYDAAYLDHVQTSPFGSTYTVYKSTRPASAQIALAFRGDADVLIDAFEVRDAAAEVEPYLRDGPYTVTFTTQDDVFSSEDFYEAENSLPPRWALESVEGITAYADALQFAREYFRTRAKVQQRPTVTLVGMVEMVPAPGQTVRLLGKNGPTLSGGDVQPIRRVLESIEAAGILTTNLQMEREQPTVEAIIRDLQRRNRRNSTVASGGSTSASGGSGGGREGAVVTTVPGSYSGVTELNGLTGDVDVASWDSSITVGTSGQEVRVKVADGGITSAKIGAAAVGISKIDASGTPSSSTFLRGDGAWASPPSGGGSNEGHYVYLNGSLEISGHEQYILQTTSGDISFAPSSGNAVVYSVKNLSGGNITIESGATTTMVGGNVTLAANGYARFVCVPDTTPGDYLAYRLV